MNNFTSDIVIGLEIHVELNTATKLFCACPTQSEHELPNTLTCPTCLGMPGAKPVVNKKAIEYALSLALALQCTLAKQMVFSRKIYFYPDMAKNYQITQYEIPLGSEGYLALSDERKIGITRVHVEEDPASLVHPNGIAHSQYVLVDYNRSGRPLCEVVTKPEIASPAEARAFLKQLITILRYLGIFDYKKGLIKADANISIKESDYTRVEIKNITGFKEIEKALEHEIVRQKNAVRNGQKIVQETRAWNAEQGCTVFLRAKETEADYGYIVDPDLAIIDISEEWKKKTSAELPLLPSQKAKEMIQAGVAKEDAQVIAAEFALAVLFSKIAKKVDPALTARWLRKEITRVAHYNAIELDDLTISEDALQELLTLVQQKEITDETAKRMLEKLVHETFSPKEYVAKEGLTMVSDQVALRTWCEEAIKENEKAAADYKKGEEKAANFLVGSVMKKSKGKAKADDVKKIIKEVLSLT